MRKLVVGSATLILSAVVLGAPANAAGCGGYVNLAVWGCAPWDNNPPKKGATPGYGTAKPAPAPPRQVVQQPVAQPSAKIISQDGGSLISNQAGGVVSDNGLGVRGGSVINPANTSSSFRR